MGEINLLFGVLTGLILLVALVVLHELGHAIAARRSGVVVEEFGVGFPPTAWKKKLKNGILLTLNWLPLGGYVKLQGEYDSATNKGDYGAATYLQKTKILFAGVMVNWLVAIVLLTIVAWFGMPKVLPNQFSVADDTTIISQPVEIQSVTKDHPAEKIGLQSGDQITRFDGQDIKSAEELITIIKKNEGKTVDLTYVRDGLPASTTVLLDGENSGGIFGATLGQRESLRATWSAPIVGFGTTVQFTIVTLQGIGDLVYNLASGVIMQFSPDASTSNDAKEKIANAGESVAGPIGILGVIFPAASSAGIIQLLFLTGIISLSLAVMNVLPIPALDGGRWTTMTIFRIMGKKLTKEREEKIQMIGFSILMGLTLLVTFVDVSKLF